MPTEKPIIFSTEMVQAILNGSKTQTRRVVKPQPKHHYDNNCKKPGWFDTGGNRWACKGCGGEIKPFTGGSKIRAPYQPGDIVWVRETWLKNAPGGVTKYFYKADKHPEEVIGQMNAFGYKWRPSIHMPRKAARLFLRVKNVRVERLQDITEADAIAEGIRQVDSRKWESSFRLGWFDSPILAFKQLWDSINAKRGFGWEINPWVWVIDFEVMK